MKDDDPEKRIRELERGLADVTRMPARELPTGESPYEGYTPPTGDAPYTTNAPYTANAPYTSGTPYTPSAPSTGGAPWGSPYGFGAPPRRRRKPYSWFLVVFFLVFFLPPIIGVVTHLVTSSTIRSAFGNGPNAPARSNVPTTVPRGGELRMSGNSENKTVACNDGKLTLAGYKSQYSVTGHCVSLTVGGYNNYVTVDTADTVESSGYNNVVIDYACNNGNLTLSSYSNVFTVTGHCASLAIKSYGNQVTVDSVDSVNVSGYNNIVTYHSGTPKITDSGSSNNIQLG